MPGQTKVVRNGGLVVGMGILRHGDWIEIDGHRARFFEIQKTVLGADNHLVGRQCLLCLGGLAAGDTAIRCPLCGTGYHEDCWKELMNKNSRCCSRNCRFAPQALPGE